MRVRDLMQIQMVSDPQISPNGDRVALVHTRMECEANEYVGNIFLVDLGSRECKQFTSGRGRDSHPRWRPDGSMLLFTSILPGRKEEKKAQLFVIETAGGEAKQLTEIEGGVRNPRWSPDGTQIIFTSLVDGGHKSETDAKAIHRIQYRYNAKGYFVGKRNHLHAISVKAGEPRQITRGEYDVDAVEWLASGHRVVFTSSLKPDADLTGDKYVYSVTEGGEPEQLTDGPRVITSIRSSPTGDEVAYIGHDYRRGLATKKDLWVVPASGGPSENLTKEFGQDIGNNLSCDVRVTSPDPNPQWSADGESLYFSSVYGGVTCLHRVTRKGGRPEKILGEADHGVEAWSLSTNGVVAYTVLQTMAPPELWVAREGKREQVTRFNRRWVRRIELCGHDRLTFRSSAGHEVEGWLMRPPGFDKRKKYPMLLQIHGGPRMAYGYSLMHEFQVLAAQGWVIMYINPFGSGGYSEDFQAGLPGHYGEQDYRDLMQAVDYVLQQFDFIDSDHLGVLGGSYGGYMTNWIVTHTDRFKVAVTMRSISNWVTMFGCSDIGWTFCRWEMGGRTPWMNEEAYMSKSPIRYVGNAKTPTLIIHAEEDYRCPVEQAEQFFTALKFQGVKAELIRFPGENHDLSREGKPKHREERLNHIIRWIKTYI